MITIWGRASSSNVQALMWAIGELKLPHLRYDAGFVYGGNNAPAFLAMNPNGTVPVLQDGENEPLWETGAILRYLAAKYADSTFWPDNVEERAIVDKWAEWAKINIALNFTAPIFWRVVRTAPSKQDPQAIQQAISRLNRFLTVAEAQLGKQAFLASSNFSLADIQFGHLLYRYFDIEIERANFPNIARYYRRISGRAAFQEHVAISYDELRAAD